MVQPELVLSEDYKSQSAGWDFATGLPTYFGAQSSLPGFGGTWSALEKAVLGGRNLAQTRAVPASVWGRWCETLGGVV